ncbi:MAG: CHAP domain-containing protein [Micropruina sp.]|uniref:CHAP domain-containing protein n=1 Tax=Micropruina sp. TaxID=2737536 RepID=UPI0039E48F52
MIGLVGPSPTTANAASIIKPAKPTISGTATVGKTLTARPGKWRPATVRLTFQWYRSGKAIPGADAQQYLLVSADKGKRISVKVTGAVEGRPAVSRTSGSTRPVAAGKLIATTPTVSGDATVGGTLTATPGDWQPAGIDFSYQWYRASKAIKGARQATYKPTSSDVKKKLKVKVTGSLAGYQKRSTTSALTSPVTNQDTSIPITSVPVVGGLLAVDGTVTVDTGRWSPGATFTYQWLRSGSPIPGATEASYRLQSEDESQQIAIRVTGHLPGHLPTTVESEPSLRVLLTHLPSYVGELRVGTTVGAHLGGWWTEGTQFSYAWFRNGKRIDGESADSLALTMEYAGSRIGLAITGTKPGYSTVTTEIEPHNQIVVLNVGTPTISGTPRVGAILSADPGIWMADVTYQYQWLREGSQIEGATTASYQPTVADIGKRLSVRVSGWAPASQILNATSASTAAVTAASLDAGTPSIGGDARVGGQVTANPGSWGPAPVSLTYQWLIDGGAVSGATGQSWTVPTSAAGRSISVRVTGSKAGYDSVARTSAGVGVPVPPPPPPPPGPIGDDYPANLKRAARDALVDPWNFYNRECTSFVAWRLNSANKVGFTNQYKGAARWGNAKTWGTVAQQRGVAVDNRPVRGAVAWSSAGEFGHVAWVAAVHGDGTITVEEYNYNWNGNYNTRRVKASSFQYIHIKDL